MRTLIKKSLKVKTKLRVNIPNLRMSMIMMMEKTNSIIASTIARKKFNWLKGIKKKTNSTGS